MSWVAVTGCRLGAYDGYRRQNNRVPRKRREGGGDGKLSSPVGSQAYGEYLMVFVGWVGLGSAYRVPVGRV